MAQPGIIYVVDYSVVHYSVFAMFCRDDNFSNKSLEHHKAVMSEMYQRDKNRPAVVFWSVANEPATNKPEAENYFRYGMI